MHTCSSSLRAARQPGRPSQAEVADLDHLELVATRLEASLSDDRSFSPDPGDHPAPLLLGAIVHGDTVELMLKPVDRHPVDELMGFTVPAEWTCIGVATGAWASTFDPSGPRRPRPTGIDRRRVRVLHLVSRSGVSVNILREASVEPVVQRRRASPLEDLGQVDDCCRRSLGLATAPAPADSRELWAYLWLDRVLAETAAGCLDRATWPDLAALHPAYTVAIAQDDPELNRHVIDHLVLAGEFFTAQHPWRELLRLTRLDAGPIPLPTEVAAWMDTGMYARTALSVFPELDDTLLDLNALLDTAPYRRLVDTIEAWGLLA